MQRLILTKKRANALEGIGLIFILLSFFSQMIEGDIESEVQELKNYQVNKKLDYVWSIVSHEYAKKYPEAGVHFAIDFKSYVEEFKIYSQDRDESNKWEQIVMYKWFTYARLSLFILGSLILIFPKFIETRD